LIVQTAQTSSKRWRFKGCLCNWRKYKAYPYRTFHQGTWVGLWWRRRDLSVEKHSL